MTTVRLGLKAWLAGLAAYIAALGLFWGEWISYGDLGAVARSSLVAFGLCYWLVYLPVLRVLRRVLPSQTPAWPFVLVAVLIGVLPTALIARYWGGSILSHADDARGIPLPRLVHGRWADGRVRLPADPDRPLSRDEPSVAASRHVRREPPR